MDSCPQVPPPPLSSISAQMFPVFLLFSRSVVSDSLQPLFAAGQASLPFSVSQSLLKVMFMVRVSVSPQILTTMSSVTIQPDFFSLMLNTYLWEMLILKDDAF